MECLQLGLGLSWPSFLAQAGQQHGGSLYDIVGLCGTLCQAIKTDGKRELGEGWGTYNYVV